jgi:hypothetical protein
LRPVLQQRAVRGADAVLRKPTTLRPVRHGQSVPAEHAELPGRDLRVTTQLVCSTVSL